MRGNEIASANGTNGKVDALYVVGILSGVIAGSVCVLINNGIEKKTDKKLRVLRTLLRIRTSDIDEWSLSLCRFLGVADTWHVHGCSIRRIYARSEATTINSD